MDNTYLSNQYIFSTDPNITHINANEIILGGTGTGKTKSIVEPRLLHADSSSYVITATKREIIDLYSISFHDKHYNIQKLDLIHPEYSELGFDPLEYLNNERDYIWFASLIVNSAYTDSNNFDHYWTEAAISLFAAEIDYLKKTENDTKIKANLKNLIEFHNQIFIKDRGNMVTTNVDHLFQQISLNYPNSLAARGYKQLSANAPKTANCILSTLNNCLDKIFTEDITRLSILDKKLDLNSFLDQKTILFILTSPVDITLQNYVSLIYGLLFKKFFTEAQYLPNYCLPIPVHFICDDFATGSKIPDFAHYISVFRSIGISVTILLQDESQLISLYGEADATTIINNCDTLVYLGGNDIKSKQNMTYRTNKPLEFFISFKVGDLLICRRGEDILYDTRYNIYQDKEYQELNKLYEMNWGESCFLK